MVINGYLCTKKRTPEDYKKLLNEQGKVLYKLNKRMVEINKINKKQILEIHSLKNKWDVLKFYLKKEIQEKNTLSLENVLKEMERIEGNEKKHSDDILFNVWH